VSTKGHVLELEFLNAAVLEGGGLSGRSLGHEEKALENELTRFFQE
jgi:hypothetical protein